MYKLTKKQEDILQFCQKNPEYERDYITGFIYKIQDDDEVLKQIKKLVENIIDSLPWNINKKDYEPTFIEEISTSRGMIRTIEELKKHISICNKSKVVFKAFLINKQDFVCLFHPIVGDIDSVKLYSQQFNNMLKNNEHKELINYDRYTQWFHSLNTDIINDQLKYRYILNNYKKNVKCEKERKLSLLHEVVLEENNLKDIDSIKRRIVQTFYYSWTKYYGSEDPTIFINCDPRKVAGNTKVVGPLENRVILSNSFMKIKKINEQNKEIKKCLQKANKNALFSSVNMSEENHKNDYCGYLNSIFISLNNIDNSILMPRIPISDSDLILSVSIIKNKLKFKVAYNNGVFESKKLNLFYKYFLYIFKTKSIYFEKLNQSLEDVFLSQSQMKKIFQIGTGKKTKNPDSLTSIFKSMVNKYPDRIAAFSKNIQLTYKEIDQLSSKIANFFRDNYKDLENGIGLNVTVDAYTIAIMLACIKLGIPYVPLDTELSEKRINYIIESSQVNLIIVNANGKRGTVNCLKKEDLLKIVNKYSSIFKVDENLEDNPIYEIYTSGTTGRPKGVILKQANVINLILGINNKCYKFNSNDRIALFTSFGFDPSVIDIFGGLLNGGTVYLPKRQIVRDIESYISYLVKNKITVINVTPPVLKVIDELCERHIPHLFLKTIFVGGDRLTNQAFKNIRKLYPNIQIINGYGPTETTVAVTFYKITTPDYKLRDIPIGTPINNVDTFVIDKNNNLLPIGAPGELLIGGKNVGLGYKNLKKKTADTFINTSYYKDKLYKSGDIVAWEKIGNKYILKFYGRKDKQVKINGYRIELNEIKSVVDKFDYIKDSVVTVKENKSNNKVLCLYYVLSKKIKRIRILNDLQTVLPRYMIPRFLCEIQSIPLNNHDKIDYGKLPNIDYDKNVNYIAPKTQNEKLVAKVFENVLKLKLNSLGINDNFLTLGGHSLNVVIACDKLEELTGIRISVKEFYQNSTIHGIAKILDEQRPHRKDNKSDNFEVKQQQNDAFIMSNAQKRMYIINQENPTSLSYNAPLKIELKYLIDIDKLKNAIKQVIKNNEILRTTFTYKNGNYLQIIHSDVEKAFEFKNVRNFSPNFIHPFNLKTGPLIRMEVKLDKPSNKTEILLDIHHIICDLLSEMLFYKQILRAYNGEKLEKPKYQYKNYSKWLLQRDKSKAKRFWRNKIKEAGIQRIKLPQSNLDNSKKDKASVKIRLSEDIVNKLNKVAKKISVSQFSCFLGSWLIFLNHISNEEKLTTGIPVAGRDNYHLSNMLGLFVNTIPFTQYLNMEEKLGDFLHNIYVNFINCENYQYYPLDEMINKFNIKSNQLFNTMLVYNESLIPMGDKVSVKEISTNDKKMDLLLGISKINNKYDLTFESTKISRKLLKKYGEDFISILSNIDNVNTEIKDVKYLSNNAKNKIIKFSSLKSLNKTSIPFIDPMSVLKQRAVQLPNKVAIYSSNEVIKNKDLFNLIKNRAMDIKQNSNSYYIGIDTHRSIKTLINIYAITYCGRAFVPINMEQSLNRNKLIIKELNIDCILTDSSISSTITGDVKLLGFPNNVKSNQNRFIYRKPNLRDTAYIIYTSGSTGKPKGVKINRNSMYKSIYQFCKDFGWNSKDKFILKTNLSFDVSLTEVWSWIYTNSSLYIPSDNVEYNSDELIQDIANQKITRLNFVPTALDVFLNSAKNHLEKIKSLKTVYVAGERLTQKIINKYVSYNYNFKLINAYGPTEDTIYATTQLVNNSTEIDSIGRPLTGKAIVIVNKFNKICPINVSGEICIAGLGLFDGYVKNKEKTEKNLINIPLFGKSMYIYKTGDIGKWSENGQLIFEGRKDSQIKIRGFRVELNEVAFQLEKIPQVLRSVVLPYKNNQDEGLIGFVKLNSNAKFNELKIKDELRQQLPKYMVPNMIFKVDKFPESLNGKIDEQKLITLLGNYTDKVELEKDITPLQAKLLENINKISMGDTIKVNDNILYSDITSIGIMRFIERSKKYLKFTYSDILKYKSIKALTENMSHTISNDESLEFKGLKKELLPRKQPVDIGEYNDKVNKIKINKNVDLDHYNKYLLLGSTGFLGIHLLHEILKDSNNKISVIVRSNNVTNAINRLKNKYLTYFNDLSGINRIKVITGDISQNHFGMSSSEYKTLLNNTQIVINGAANVKHHDLIKNIFDPNVIGVKNIIAFCKQNNAKLVQISTISVGSGTVPDTDSLTFSEFDFNVGQKKLNEYVYSKLLAESLVVRAVQNKEINAQIIRLGNVCFDSKNGQFQTNISSNAFYEIVKSFLSMQILPDKDNVSLDLTYVDQAAKAILALSQVKSKKVLLYHLVNSLDSAEKNLLWDKLMSIYPKIRILSIDKIKKIQEDPRNSSSDDIENINIFSENSATKFVIKTELTNSVLRQIGFCFPKLTEKMVKDMIDYGRKVNFFE